MKPLRPSPPYGFLCTLSLAGPQTGVYPSLNWWFGSCGIKVSRLFPLGCGSPKHSTSPLLLPHFYHHAHSVVLPFFETQLHASKLLTPPAIPHLHHQVLELYFALDETFRHLWHSFALGPFATHVRSTPAHRFAADCFGARPIYRLPRPITGRFPPVAADSVRRPTRCRARPIYRQNQSITGRIRPILDSSQPIQFGTRSTVVPGRFIGSLGRLPVKPDRFLPRHR
jgi:hypothetical protein